MPVIVGPVDDPEDLVVGLARLMQQAADLLQCARHLVPPRIEDGAPCGCPAPAAADVIRVIMAVTARGSQRMAYRQLHRAARGMCGDSRRRYTALATALITILAGYRSRMRTLLPARPGPGR
jgi:hypothetical protein